MQAVFDLVGYALDRKLIEDSDRVYVTNLLFEKLKIEGCEEKKAKKRPLEEILSEILDFAAKNKLCENTVTSRDLFDTSLMGVLTPRPSDVIEKFKKEYAISAENATDWFYEFCKSCDYIRTYRIKKDLKWQSDTPYGKLDVTVNLSKPEKDPVAIAAARNVHCGYPKCALCAENVGFAGTLSQAARQNHRIIPLTLSGEKWYFQFSPYVYYKEHCIVFNSAHIPMKVDASTFARLFDFIEQFPHYFIGSNADLPIVGGSILTHEHFQGGRYSFAMERAEKISSYLIKGYENVSVDLLKWPMSVIRLESENRYLVESLADKFLAVWRSYTSQQDEIYAVTDQPHNTITPIARMNGERYRLYLVFRNNFTNSLHPLGVFHPHRDKHHIKKENIGLIEVMGLAVLPSRLKKELEELSELLLSSGDVTCTNHSEWALRLIEKYRTFERSSVKRILEQEVGNVYAAVLEDCGVFKSQQSADRFMSYCEERF